MSWADETLNGHRLHYDDVLIEKMVSSAELKLENISNT